MKHVTQFAVLGLVFLSFLLSSTSRAQDSAWGKIRNKYNAVSSALNNAGKAAIKAGSAYGREFNKMYLDPDTSYIASGAVKGAGAVADGAKTAWRAVENPTSYSNWPTYHDWLGFGPKAEKKNDPGFGALMQVALHNEENMFPLSVSGDNNVEPLDFAKNLIQNGAQVNKPHNQGVKLTVEPEGVCIPVEGLTPVAAAALSCNHRLIRLFGKSGADFSGTKVTLFSSCQGQKALKKESDVFDLVAFRKASLIRSVSTLDFRSQHKQWVNAENMITRCERTMDELKTAMNIPLNETPKVVEHALKVHAPAAGSTGIGGQKPSHDTETRQAAQSSEAVREKVQKENKIYDDFFDATQVRK